MKILMFISRILVGIVFVFSGFVKAVDPLGSNYKFVDYFSAFGTDWMYGLAFPLAIVLSSFEFIVGISLIFNARIRQGAWGALIFMAFFTPLTFYLALTNPVKDCGCFGDALILDNWETFYKNIILFGFTLFLFLKRKNFVTRFNGYAEWLVAAVFAAVIIGTSIYSYNHLPIIDFRPYKVGTHIPTGMSTPDDAPLDVYKIVSVYEKDGVEKEFIDPEYPDSTWNWVSTDSELVKKGYEAPIHDFMIEDEDGYDITSEILSNPGFTFMLIAYDLNKSNIDAQQKINELSGYCMANGHDFICLTASGNTNEFKANTEAYYDFYNMDEITLKTIIRANPGLVLIKEGTILGKLHFNDIPELDEFGDNFLAYTLNQFRKKTQDLLILSFILSGLLLVSFFVMLNFMRNKNYPEI
jgi:uncharacterized membrane protein YphA (DoxX/SURF4 family)